MNSFYDEQDPNAALKTYFKIHDNLYNRTKELTIRDFFLKSENLKESSVLEIGAAGGIWTKYFLDSGARVTVVEILPQMIDANKRVNPKANYVCADATTVQLEQKFDLIFAKDVIEHIVDDIKFFKNMSYHLKKSGRLFVNTQNSRSLNYFFQGGFQKLKGNKKWCGWDPTHIRFYNSFSLSQKLNTAGLKAERWFGSYYFPYRLLTERLGPKWEHSLFHFIEYTGLCRRFPLNRMGWNIAVVGRKYS